MENLCEQQQALREGCGVTELPLSVVRVAGNDRVRFLHNFCTADIKRLQPNHCCEAFFLNTRGKTISHGFVISRDVDLLIVSSAKSPDAMLENMDRYLLSEDVELSDVSSLWRCVFVCGSQCDSTLEQSGIRLTNPQVASVVGFQVAVNMELAGDGVLILEPANGDASIVSQLSDSGATDCCLETLNDLRIEKQVPWCDHDVTDNCLPQEFRRDEKAISFTKGCYLGQETVAKLDAMGSVSRFFCGIQILDGQIHAGDALRLDGIKIGIVTSVSKNEIDGKRYALAFIRVKHSTPETVHACEGVSIKVL